MGAVLAAQAAEHQEGSPATLLRFLFPVWVPTGWSWSRGSIKLFFLQQWDWCDAFPLKAACNGQPHIWNRRINLCPEALERGSFELTLLCLKHHHKLKPPWTVHSVHSEPACHIPLLHATQAETNAHEAPMAAMSSCRAMPPCAQESFIKKQYRRTGGGGECAMVLPCCGAQPASGAHGSRHSMFELEMPLHTGLFSPSSSVQGAAADNFRLTTTQSFLHMGEEESALLVLWPG